MRNHGSATYFGHLSKVYNFSGYTLDRNEAIVYETPKLPLEVALLQGCFESARILLLYGCSTFSGMTDLVKRIEEHCDSPDTVTDFRRLAYEPKPFRFLTLRFVTETVAANNVCSVETFNSLVNTLPVLNEELKGELMIKLKQ